GSTILPNYNCRSAKPGNRSKAFDADSTQVDTGHHERAILDDGDDGLAGWRLQGAGRASEPPGRLDRSTQPFRAETCVGSPARFCCLYVSSLHGLLSDSAHRGHAMKPSLLVVATVMVASTCGVNAADRRPMTAGDLWRV